MQEFARAPSRMPGQPVPVLPATFGWIAGCLLVFAALLVLRNPYVFVKPQFWNEDMTVFFQQARTAGPSSVFTPFAGYLSFYQRLSACFAGFFPIEFAPLLYTLATFAGWLWVAVLSLTSSVFVDRRWAFAATLALLLVPSHGEIYMILTNIQWVFGAVLALLLVERSPPCPAWPRIFYACVAGLTGPFSLLLAPVALLKGVFVWRSSRKIDFVAMAILITALLQLALVLTYSGRLQQAAGVDPATLALGLSLGVFPELFGTYHTFPEDAWLRLAGGIAGLIGALWICGGHLPGAATRRVLLLAGALMLAAGLMSCFTIHGGGPRAFGKGSRYLFVPFVIYAWCLIDAWSRAPRLAALQLVPAALLSALLIHSAEKPVAPRHRTVDWSLVCRDLRAGHSVKFQIPPHSEWVTLQPVQGGR
jgi:hypothetical protein